MLTDLVRQGLSGARYRTARLVSRAAGVESLGVHLAALFDLMTIDCVIDVGANRGQYGRLLRRIGYRGRIVSFEPLPEGFAELNRRAALDSAWTTVRLALGGEDAVRPFHVASGTEFSSFRQTSVFGRTFGGAILTRIEPVSLRRLDAVWPEHSRGASRLHLKLDTQGYDTEVLRGAGSVLEQVVSVQTELSVQAVYQDAPRYPEALAELERLGFELTGLFPTVRDRGLRVVELDGVLRRRER